MPDVSIVKNVADRICDNVENVIIGKRHCCVKVTC